MNALAITWRYSQSRPKEELARRQEQVARREEKLAAKTAAQPKEVETKVGRNERCPCGSRLEYTHCHGLPGR